MISPALSSTIAVVIPVFNEEPVLPELFRRLCTVFDRAPGLNWRVLLVDDGSRDHSAALIENHAATDTRFTLLRLSRNFGFQSALMAGLEQASLIIGVSGAVITMDADLQDPPELLIEMIGAWRKGCEVALAVRRSRRETGLRRLGFDVFHQLFVSLSDYPVTPNTGTFGLMDGQALAALLSLPERNRFFPALRSWIGFRVVHIEYDRHERHAGQPGQTLGRLFRYALDGIFSFSYLPLRLVTYTGVAVAGGGFAVGLFFVMRRLMGIEIAFTGFTTLISVVLLIGGIQLMGIGILGEYLGRIYDEVKRRPHYLLRK